jgi:hypothetical protein
VTVTVQLDALEDRTQLEGETWPTEVSETLRSMRVLVALPLPADASAAKLTLASVTGATWVPI